MSFYTQNALNISANSSIEKFLLDLGVYENSIPPSYSGAIGYEEALGTYLPSNERCVVQPLSEYTFSQGGNRQIKKHIPNYHHTCYNNTKQYKK